MTTLHGLYVAGSVHDFYIPMLTPAHMPNVLSLVCGWSVFCVAECRSFYVAHARRCIILPAAHTSCFNLACDEVAFLAAAAVIAAARLNCWRCKILLVAGL